MSPGPLHGAVAHDAPERDPTSYQLYGSNTVSANTTPGALHDLAQFTLISGGGVAS